jgi:hypothetical protein
MASKYTYEETKMIRDIATAMKKNQGPFTKVILIGLLENQYPKLSYQELKNKIARAFVIDKYCKQRFKSVRVGVWDLVERKG